MSSHGTDASQSRKEQLEEGEVLEDDGLEVRDAEVDLEAVMAEKKRKRLEIMARYSNTANTPVSRELNAPAKKLKLDSPAPATPIASDPGTPEPVQQTFDLAQSHHHTAQQDEVSAADYNPDADRKRDEERAIEQGKEALLPAHHHQPAPVEDAVDEAEGEWEEVEATEEEAGSEEDDMFAVISSKPPKKRVTKVRRKVATAAVAQGARAAQMVIIDRADPATAIADDSDDAEGYYKVILGELLDDGRYHVHANLGKGMFSSVVRARDLQDDGKEVAIKMIRSQETMYKAGQKEVGILKKLNEADPTDKRHLVRLYRTFEHRGHLCLVFESLSLNLREVVKRFGKDVGINLKAVRAYAHQMFLGLGLMRKCNIMHADIKPDNLLVSENHSQLKISDLGSASDTSENDITPYLVSRFYRAPEIILGLPYDCALDMWSIGCTLYELYTGKILFPGRNNNQMLLYIQQTKGRLTNRMIKRSRFGEQHFDESGAFVTAELNKATGTESVKKLNLPVRPSSDLKSRLMPPGSAAKMSMEEARSLTYFVDLLEKSLDLDPVKRLQPADALKHPFLR